MSDKDVMGKKICELIDERTHARNLAKQFEQERDGLKAALDTAKIVLRSDILVLTEQRNFYRDQAEAFREALEFISCDGMDDADFYAEEDVTCGAIDMANRARTVLIKHPRHLLPEEQGGLG